MTWNPESNTVLDSLPFGRDIKKKFKGVAHSSENTSSRFCLKVLKLLIWTDSIYFNANLTLSFVGLSKDRFLPFKLWTNVFVERKLLCIILYHLPHPRSCPPSKLSILGDSWEVTRERTRVRGASPLSRAFSRGFPYTFLGQKSIYEQWTCINLRMGLELLLVYKRIPRNIDNEN